MRRCAKAAAKTALSPRLTYERSHHDERSPRCLHSSFFPSYRQPLWFFEGLGGLRRSSSAVVTYGLPIHASGNDLASHVANVKAFRLWRLAWP